MAKKKVVKHRKQSSVQAAIPDGFRPIVDEAHAPKHDFDTYDTLVGTVKSIRKIVQGKGKQQRIVRIMTVDRGDMFVSVWESAGLRILFDQVQPDQRVYIRYVGEVAIKGRKQPMHAYQCAIEGEVKRARARKG